MCKNQRGVTMVELMIAMTVSLLVIAGGFAAFLIQNSSADVQYQVSAMQQNGRVAMDTMVAEIQRGAYNNALNNAGAQVIFDSDTSSEITIQKDVNDDGDILDADEVVVFSLAGGQLLMNNVVLADNVRSLTFAPSGGVTAGTVTTNPTSILVALTVRTSREDPNYTAGFDFNPDQPGTARTRIYTKEVWIRNLNL